MTCATNQNEIDKECSFQTNVLRIEDVDITMLISSSPHAFLLLFFMKADW